MTSKLLMMIASPPDGLPETILTAILTAMTAMDGTTALVAAAADAGVVNVAPSDRALLVRQRAFAKSIDIKIVRGIGPQKRRGQMARAIVADHEAVMMNPATSAANGSAPTETGIAVRGRTPSKPGVTAVRMHRLLPTTISSHVMRRRRATNSEIAKGPAANAKDDAGGDAAGVAGDRAVLMT